MKPVNLAYRFFALMMALLMLVTSVGFVLDVHYCQGQLKSVNALGKAKNCHEMAASMKSCPHDQQAREAMKSCSMEQKGCCENKVVRIQSEQNQEIISSELELSIRLQQLVIAYVLVFLSEHLLTNDLPVFKLYKPPLISRDIYVLFESFLL